MENTRIDLTVDELRWLKAFAPDFRTLIQRVASYLRIHGSSLKIETERKPTKSVHISFDEADWEEISKWMARYGNQKGVTKKQLILHVCDLIAAEFPAAIENPASPEHASRERKRLDEIRRIRYRLKIVDRTLFAPPAFTMPPKTPFEKAELAKLKAEHDMLVDKLNRLQWDEIG